MNRSDLRQLAANFCEDKNLTRFTSAQYNDGLDKAQKQFCLDSKALTEIETYTMALDDADYDLPSDFIKDKQVTLNGLPLSPISRDELQRIYVSKRWDNIEGIPTNYIIDPIEDTKSMILFPIPNTVSYGTSLKLRYAAYPTTMSSDTASPFNGSELMAQYQIAIPTYAAWLLLGYIPPTEQTIVKRKDLFAQYSGKVNEAIQEFGDTRSAKLSIHPRDIRVR